MAEFILSILAAVRCSSAVAATPKSSSGWGPRWDSAQANSTLALRATRHDTYPGSSWSPGCRTPGQECRSRQTGATWRRFPDKLPLPKTFHLCGDALRSSYETQSLPSPCIRAVASRMPAAFRGWALVLPACLWGLPMDGCLERQDRAAETTTSRLVTASSLIDAMRFS